MLQTVLREVRDCNIPANLLREYSGCKDLAEQLHKYTVYWLGLITDKGWLPESPNSCVINGSIYPVLDVSVLQGLVLNADLV